MPLLPRQGIRGAKTLNLQKTSRYQGTDQLGKFLGRCLGMDEILAFAGRAELPDARFPVAPWKKVAYPELHFAVSEEGLLRV